MKNITRLGLVALLILIVGSADTYAQRRKTDKKREKDKERKVIRPYYEKAGYINLNLGVQLFKRPRTSSLPIYLHPEVTVAKNISVGFDIMYYRYQHDIEYDSYTNWPEEDIKFSHLMIGAKASYHLTEHISSLGLNINPANFDFYASGLVGYNLIFGDGQDNFGNQITSDFEKKDLRYGISVGLRRIYSNQIGLFFEAGFASYGFASFGATWLFGKAF